MKKNRLFLKNTKGVSHPLELIFMISVILISFSFIFTAANHLFASYTKDEFVLRAKAIGISEKLIKDTGFSINGDRDWEFYPSSEISDLGLASYKIINDTWYLPPPFLADYASKTNIVYEESNILNEIENISITNYTYKIFAYSSPVRIKNVISNKIDYGTLDSDKIYALNKVYYIKAKRVLGLESYYDFNIIITDVNKTELLKYGKSYENRQVIGSFSRNIRVYDAYSTSYKNAKLTVYIF